MARLWIEQYDRSKHRNHMASPNSYRDRADALVSQPVYCVRVCGFTFEFFGTEQIAQCLEFFSQKTHPSSIIPWGELGQYGGDQHETQRWFERLPLWLFEEPKRAKVVKALRQALGQWPQASA